MSRTKFPFYPGCTLKTKAENFERSGLAVTRALNLELIEPERWNCCGTVFSLTDDDLIHHVAPIRNLIRIEEMNKNGIVDESRVVVFCSMCYNTLKRANLRVKENDEDLEKINNLMYLEDDYKKSIEVIHFLQLLQEIGFDKIKEKVKKPLTNLNVAPYYGCMLLRPKEVGIDDPEDPVIQDELINALGANPIDYPYKKVCCGSYQTVHEKEAVAGLTYDILTNAQNEGADVVITSCPLCAFNLDNRQKEVKKTHPEFKEIPILYFSQLMAIAFDLDKKTFGFDLNYIDPKPILKSKNLL